MGVKLIRHYMETNGPSYYQGIVDKNKRLREQRREIIKEFDRNRLNKRHCQECGSHLDPDDEYHMRFGFCNEDCGMKLYGLHWSDFI